MFKQLTACFASAALVATMCVPTTALAAEDASDTTNAVTFKGGSFGSADAASPTISVTFNTSWLAPSSVKTYNPKLASWAATLSTDIYPNVTTTVGGKITANKAKYLEAFGFEDVEFVSTVAKGASTDKDDDTAVVMGHRLIQVNGQPVDEFVLIVRGTDGSQSQWDSNFDLGADTAGYSSNSASEHPEWVNKSNHKGFDVTASRVDSTIASYMAKHAAAGATTTLMITGHSRGAAVANILGAAYEGSSTTPKVNVGDYSKASESIALSSSCAYSFAAPATTSSKDVSRSTVFNLVNTDDLVVAIPTTSWGFVHYGRDLGVAASKSAAVKSRVKQLTGSAYGASKQTTLLNAIYDISTGRSDMYSTAVKGRTAAVAAADVDALEKAVADLGVGKFVTIAKNGDGSATKAVMPAAFLRSVGRLIAAASGGNFSGVVKTFISANTVFADTTYESVLAKMQASLTGVSSSVIGAHGTAVYLAIAENGKAAQLVQCSLTAAFEGDTVTISGSKYKVLSTASKTVAYAAPVSTSAKSAKVITVPATVKVNGTSYKVAGISAKAFAKAKATKVVVKSASLTKAGVKNSLKGSKVTTVSVPKAKKTAYKGFFVKGNCGKAVAVK